MKRSFDCLQDTQTVLLRTLCLCDSAIIASNARNFPRAATPSDGDTLTRGRATASVPKNFPHNRLSATKTQYSATMRGLPLFCLWRKLGLHWLRPEKAHTLISFFSFPSSFTSLSGLRNFCSAFLSWWQWRVGGIWQASWLSAFQSMVSHTTAASVSLQVEGRKFITSIFCGVAKQTNKLQIWGQSSRLVAWLISRENPDSEVLYSKSNLVASFKWRLQSYDSSLLPWTHGEPERPQVGRVQTTSFTRKLQNSPLQSVTGV